MRMLRALVLVVLFSTLLAAQGVPIKSGATSDLAGVNTNKALSTAPGDSTRDSYAVILLSVAYTAVDSLINLEAEAGRGFQITQICINPGWATAVAQTTWQLIRTTTASSAGTVISAESTTTHTVSKMNPASSNWSGIARTSGTEGTSGAVLDQGTIFVPINVTPPAVPRIFCRDYKGDNGQPPTVIAGTTNGVKLMFTGTAGGATQSAYLRFNAVP
jgi:hypothetical protein